jgi:hypothetical protein
MASSRGEPGLTKLESQLRESTSFTFVRSSAAAYVGADIQRTPLEVAARTRRAAHDRNSLPVGRDVPRLGRNELARRRSLCGDVRVPVLTGVCECYRAHTCYSLPWEQSASWGR